jgi:dTDP-4-dehydrorhamnose 3,5-epimerase-like enzyme
MTRIQLLKCPVFVDVNGQLGVFEQDKAVPFDIKRVFCITAAQGALRADHAHRLCTQMLVCLTGSIKISYDDGRNTGVAVLSGMDNAFMASPGVWLNLEFASDNAVLMVLCDRVYEPEDYIHTRAEFAEFTETRDR